MLEQSDLLVPNSKGCSSKLCPKLGRHCLFKEIRAVVANSLSPLCSLLWSYLLLWHWRWLWTLSWCSLLKPIMFLSSSLLDLSGGCSICAYADAVSLWHRGKLWQQQHLWVSGTLQQSSLILHMRLLGALASPPFSSFLEHNVLLGLAVPYSSHFRGCLLRTTSPTVPRGS